MPLFSKAQESILGIVSVLVAPLSAVGSALILWSIYKNRERTLRSTYHRLILGMSILDLCGSISMILLGPWALPKESGFVMASAKNFHACEASAFFLTLLLGGMWYSCFLSLNFVFLIKYEWKEKTLKCCLEPMAHMMAFLFPLISGIEGVVANMMNPVDILPGWCWFAEPSCHTKKDMECTRGDTSTSSSIAGTAIFIFCVIAVCMILILRKVYTTEVRLREYGDHQRELAKTKETGHQALLYIGSFFLTYFPVVLLEALYEFRHNYFYFFVAMLVKTLTPLQGFFNAFIYLRTRREEVDEVREHVAQMTRQVLRRSMKERVQTLPSDMFRTPESSGATPKTSDSTGERVAVEKSEEAELN